MNKMNYLLVSVVIILLISNIFLYSNLNKQNLGIKKDISDLKQEQTSQQASQKESMVNLQNLATFNWKTYQNDKFGFSFKYPEYVNLCDETTNLKNFEKTDLDLRIRPFPNDTCDSKDFVPAYIIVKKNTENYKTAEEAFNKEFLKDYTTPIKYNFKYFKIGGFDSFGGENIFLKPSSDPQDPRISDYKAVILKNNYLIKFDGGFYNDVFENRKKFGDKPIFDAMISSFNFSPFGLLK